MLKHLLWKIALSGIKHKRDFTKRLNQIARKLRIQENNPAWEDLKKTSRKLRKARKEKREARRKVREEIREINVKEFIENLPINTDHDKAKKQKETIERQMNQFRQIKQGLRKKNTGCIAHIIVPEPEREYPYDPEQVQNWKEVYEPKEVEDELLKRNKAHFGQAAITRFAKRKENGTHTVHSKL